MKIDCKGRQIEAFNLIMRKEYAKEILAGRKRVEFRKYSPFYVKMFSIEDNFNENNRRIAEAEANGQPDPELLDEISPIRAIHFRPYTKSWHMNCLIDGIKLIGCDAGGAAELRRDWHSHELDEFNGVPNGKGPLVFALRITEILDHKGL